MPLNKNASFRYRVIDQCLGRKYKRHTLEELVTEVSNALREQFGLMQGVSKRTIQADIQIMRSLPPRGFGAEIICEHGHYFYADTSYSILNAPLNTTDINALKEIGLLLGQFTFLPHFERLKQMLQKLKGHTERQLYERELISLEMKQYVAGMEYQPLIFDALLDGRQLQIVYKPFREMPIAMLVHPFLLKEYNNRWYLLCQSDHREGLSVLALDRMQEVKQLEYKAVDCPVDTATYYNNVIGVTITAHEQIEEVVFSITDERLPYLETKPLHQTQKVETDGDKHIVRLQVIINNELKSNLLSLSPDIKVLNPPSLVEDIKGMIGKAIEQYET